VSADGAAAGALAEERERVCVSAENGGVVAEPLQRQNLVVETHVASRAGFTVARLRSICKNDTTYVSDLSENLYKFNITVVEHGRQGNSKKIFKICKKVSDKIKTVCHSLRYYNNCSFKMVFYDFLRFISTKKYFFPFSL